MWTETTHQWAKICGGEGVGCWLLHFRTTPHGSRTSEKCHKVCRNDIVFDISQNKAEQLHCLRTDGHTYYYKATATIEVRATTRLEERVLVGGLFNVHLHSLMCTSNARMEKYIA